MHNSGLNCGRLVCFCICFRLIFRISCLLRTVSSGSFSVSTHKTNLFAMAIPPCRSFGAQVLIDDNPRYAMECANDGMRVLLFDYDNSYPWCKTGVDESHPLVTKVHNWEEVEEKLLSWVVPES